MGRDIRSTPGYREVEHYFTAVLGPGFGRPQNPASPVGCPDGHLVAFTGEVLRELEGCEEHRIWVADLSEGSVRQVTFGPQDDKGPAWSPDGTRLTFLSDRRAKGRHQLC